MILVDADLLLDAVNSAAAQHENARRRLDATLSATEEVGIAWSVVLSFVRIETHPGLFPRPFSIHAAAARMDAWLGQPVARVLDRGTGRWARSGKLPRQTLCAVPSPRSSGGVPDRSSAENVKMWD